MESKEFVHAIIEKCKLSKKRIDTKREKYTIILDCYGPDIQSIGFYKTETLRALIEGNKEFVVKELLQRQNKVTKTLLNRFGIPTGEIELPNEGR